MYVVGSQKMAIIFALNVDCVLRRCLPEYEIVIICGEEAPKIESKTHNSASAPFSLLISFFLFGDGICIKLHICGLVFAVHYCDIAFVTLGDDNVGFIMSLHPFYCRSFPVICNILYNSFMASHSLPYYFNPNIHLILILLVSTPFYIFVYSLFYSSNALVSVLYIQ